MYVCYYICYLAYIVKLVYQSVNNIKKKHRIRRHVFCVFDWHRWEKHENAHWVATALPDQMILSVEWCWGRKGSYGLFIILQGTVAYFYGPKMFVNLLLIHRVYTINRLIILFECNHMMAFVLPVGDWCHSNIMLPFHSQQRLVSTLSLEIHHEPSKKYT